MKPTDNPMANSTNLYGSNQAQIVCVLRISQYGDQRSLDLRRVVRYQNAMRKVVGLLILLLFVGHHGVSASNFSLPNFMERSVEQALDTSGETHLRALQRCCDGNDDLNTSGRTASCSSADCSFTNASFDLVFIAQQHIPSFEVLHSANAAFRHALFRPPIA
mgnify:CR=1 FL=1